MSNSLSDATATAGTSDSTAAGDSVAGSKLWAGGSIGTERLGRYSRGAAAWGSGTGVSGCTGADGASWTKEPMAWVIFSSKGLRGADCRDMAMKRDSTSREAEREAAADWARSMGGKALAGPAAGAGGNHVAEGLIEGFAGALNALEVIA